MDQFICRYDVSSISAGNYERLQLLPNVIGYFQRESLAVVMKRQHNLTATALYNLVFDEMCLRYRLGDCLVKHELNLCH